MWKNYLSSHDRTAVEAVAAHVVSAIHEYDYEYFGLRRETYRPRDGSRLSNSWNHESDREICGTSTIGPLRPDIETVEWALRTLMPYMGEWVVLVGSNRRCYDYDEDPGEAVLVRPIVLEIYQSPVPHVAGMWKY